MTHSTIVAFKRRTISSQTSIRQRMVLLLSALTLATGPAAWAATPTTTTLYTTPTSPSSGQVITMVAQVSSQSLTVAGGTVTFTDKFNNVTETLGKVQVQAKGSPGTAILKVEVGGIGQHNFTALYSGTSPFLASTSTVATVTFVGPYRTSTALVSANTTPDTLTATVSAYGPVAPTGSVTFSDATANFTLGTVNLNSATLKTGFAPVATYPISGGTTNTVVNTTGGTVAPAIGDFNNDGYPDYVVPTNATAGGPVVILLGTGNGTFTNGTSLTGISNSDLTTSAVVGDFDGDGNQDIAVLATSGNVYTFLGSGNGLFTLKATLAEGTSNPLIPPMARFLAIGDFDGDGRQDLVATNSNTAADNVAVMLGKGDGTFTTPVLYTVGATGTFGDRPWNVVVGDLNKDGNLDIATASDGSSYIGLLMGKGDGTFNTYTTVNTTGDQVGSVTIGDFNGDGLLDLATSDATKGNIYVLLNTTTAVGGTPTFGTPRSYVATPGPYYLTVGDFNRDGHPDFIAALNGTNTTAATQVAVLANNGTGTNFGPATYYTIGSGSYFANAADINGDDQVDLTAVTATGVSVLLSGESEQAALSGVTYNGCSTTPQSIVATFNDASANNPTYGSSTSSPVTKTVKAQATTLSLSINPTKPAVGQQITFTATLSPYAYGSQTTNGEAVNFQNNGSTFATGYLSNGVATATISAPGTGNYSITATFGGDCAFSASTSSPAQTVTVLQSPGLAWATPAAITYGTPLSNTQLDATASVAGKFVYTPALGAIEPAGTDTLSVTFTPTDTTDYATETATVQLTVNKEALVLTWPTPEPISYGTPLSSFQLDAVASTGVQQVNLSSVFNVSGIYDPGYVYSTNGFDGDGYSYSSTSISGSIVYNGLTFTLGPVNAPDAVYGTGTATTLPQGNFTDLYLLGAMVNNNPAPDSQNFKVTYTDGTSVTTKQSMSDWVYAAGYAGESIVNCSVKRNYSNGTTASQQDDNACVYAYDIKLNSAKTVQSITLPNNNPTNHNIVFLAMDLVTPPIPGTYVYTPPAGTIEPVGTDTLSVTFTPNDSTDYQPVSGTVNLVVKPASFNQITPTIAWANPAPITFGTPLSSTQLDATAMAPSSPQPVTPQSQLSVLAISNDRSSYVLNGFDTSGNTYSYTQLNNGSIAYAGATFTLGSPTVPDAITNGAVYTLATPAYYSNLYLIGAADTTGQTQQPFTLTYSDGTTSQVFIDMSSWQSPQGYAGETTVATSTYSNTGSGGENSSPVYLYGYTASINSAKQLVSVTLPSTRNDVILALGFGNGGQVVVPGTYAYNPPAGTIEPVGVDTLNVTFTPSNTAAYTTATDSVPITVTQGVPVITWPTPDAVPVGTTLSSTQLDATASINGSPLSGTYTYTQLVNGNYVSATNYKENTPGTYTLKVLFTPSDNTDYSTATATVQLVVGTTATSITGSTGFQAAECCFFSQPTPYNITVAGAGAAPTGTVSVMFGTQMLGSGTLLPGSGSSSTAALMLNSIYFVPGNNNVTLNYLGDTNYVPSSAATTIPLRNPAIEANPATVPGGSSTLLIPYAFPVAGSITFSFNPLNGSISDFGNSGSSTCSAGTTETAGFVCSFAVSFNPELPGIRKGVVQVNFTDGNGNAEPTLYLYLSGLGDAAQLSLSSATQAVLSSGLNQPQGITFNPSDMKTATLYIANGNASMLDTMPASGGALAQFASASSRGNLNYPDDVAFDAFGNLLVPDQNAGAVFEFAPTSPYAITTLNTGSYTLGTPTAARLDLAGNIYVADAGKTPRILQVNGETYDTTYTPTVMLTGSQVSYPQMLAVDNTGSYLYVGDGNLNTVQQISLSSSAVTPLAISPCDTTVSSCAFNSPAGMAFDPNGDMFITDSGERVLMIPANHSNTAPTTQLPFTTLNNPTGIVLDGYGNVYISDLNTRILELQVNSGAVKVGTSAATKITNTGNLNLTISSLKFGTAGGFAETDNCTSSAIVPGGSCTITITNPGGAASDTLTIKSNAYTASGSATIAVTK